MVVLRRARQQQAAAGCQAAAQQGVERRGAGRDHALVDPLLVFAGHQPRKHLQPPAVEVEVVLAAAELHAAQLHHAQPPLVGAIVVGVLVQVQHAVRDAVQVLVAIAARAVVEHQHRAAALREEALEREDLAPVAQRALGQQPHLRQAVEDHALRLLLVDQAHHVARGLPELELRGMQHRLLGLLAESLVAHQVVDLDALERPAVRGSHLGQFLGGFGQRDVEPALARGTAGLQELQRERGLARARRALDQVEVLRGQPAAEDVVEAGDARGGE